MRRAPLVVAATVAGVAAVLGYQPADPAGSAGRPTASSRAADGRQVAGDVVATQYGDVQVRITVRGGKVADVTALALPGAEPRSSQINATAGPLLRDQVLRAQSADVDGISGATITSGAYERSARSALSRAGLP